VVLDGRCIQDHFPGIARYTFNLATHLGSCLAAGDDLTVLIDPAVVNTWFDLSQLRSTLGLKIYPIAAPIFSIPGLIRTAAALRALQPDVYHSPYYLYPPPFGARAVVTVFDLIPETSRLRSTTVERLRRLVYRLTVASGTHRATRIIVPSAACAADLRRLHGASDGQIVQVPLGVDPAFRPVDRTSIVHLRERFCLPSRVILTVGVNKPHKNLAGLVRALEFLPRDVALVVAGPRDHRYPDAREIAEHRGLGDRVVSLGMVASADLPSLYAAADVFAFPSFDEGFGLPPLEAMACGTPVACSGAGSLPDVVGQAAVLFDPTDPSDIAASLRPLLDDERLRQQYRGAGFARAATFKWESVAKATWRVYWDAWSTS
jgi:alpha-1,3-rhamnosyl/mannosyltransferase